MNAQSNWNVISEYEFKSRINNIFERVADALSKTLGPYGSTTIIEQYGEMHITKDGWQVLKNIKFDNVIDNNILLMLQRISSQVVIKVGDGSTSSIIAANEILNELNKSNVFKTYRPKDVMDILIACTTKIVEAIYNESIKINTDNYDEIYRLAYVSTNGDEQIANIVKDIYEKTGNPSIDYVKSKTNKTSYEIIDGYRTNVTYLDNLYVNNDDGTCVVENPAILIFDHKIDVDTSLPIISAAMNKITCENENRKLVVVAPYYDKYLLEIIRQRAVMEYKQRGTTTIIYTRATLINNISHEMYNDFSVLCGSQIISEQFANEINDENITEYLGGVERMVIGPVSTLIKGFVCRNENMYNKIVSDATVKYNNALIENQSRGIVDIKLNEYKQRLTKLHCSMGIISVGGNSELEKAANVDLVDDAVKACESAYNYGYNIGGSLIIPRVITNIMQNDDLVEIKEKFGTELTDIIFNIIKIAFINVYATVLTNKYRYDDSTDLGAICEIINNTEELGYTKCYDLINDEFSDKIINSCETDIEILKASISIISLLTSSNQYISIMTNSDNE